MKMKAPTPLVVVNFFVNKLGICDFKARLAASVLNKKARKCNEPADYIDLSFRVFNDIPWKYLGWSIKPLQVKMEIQTLLSILSEEKVHTMLEIGTANGGTLFLFSRVLESNAKIISIDLPKGRFGGGYDNFKIPFFTNFAQKDQRIFLIRADSHSESSASIVKSILKNQRLDFLFIDGDHTYKGVKKDFQTYSPLVRKGGLIAIHDICTGPPELAGEVNKFWTEIRNAYAYQEIIYSSNEKGFGIGVLYA
jgi:predicted O-methyltransferase YrrM